MITAVVNLDTTQTTMMFVVIEKGNLDRMKHADPITLESHSVGGSLPVIKYPAHLRVLIAYEEDAPKMQEILSKEGLLGLFKYLERGSEFKEGLDGIHYPFMSTHSPEES